METCRSETNAVIRRRYPIRNSIHDLNPYKLHGWTAPSLISLLIIDIKESGYMASDISYTVAV